MPVIQTQDSEAPLWTNNFITDIFRWLPDSYSFIYIKFQPSQIHSAIFLEYRVSISKNFRYGELHFKISPGNPVAFRHQFNLSLTCSIHCVKWPWKRESNT